MVRRLGLFIAGAFVLGGVLGFVPAVTKDGMYFGLFMVNPAHNILHVLSGGVLLGASVVDARAARFCFQALGAFYLAIAVIGLAVGDGLILGLISNNRYDAFGHGGLALLMLWIGFGTSGLPQAAGRSRP